MSIGRGRKADEEAMESERQGSIAREKKDYGIKYKSSGVIIITYQIIYLLLDFLD